jgi:hypothetical protein
VILFNIFLTLSMSRNLRSRILQEPKFMMMVVFSMVWIQSTSLKVSYFDDLSFLLRRPW